MTGVFVFAGDFILTGVFVLTGVFDFAGDFILTGVFVLAGDFAFAGDFGLTVALGGVFVLAFVAPFAFDFGFDSKLSRAFIRSIMGSIFFRIPHSIPEVTRAETDNKSRRNSRYCLSFVTPRITRRTRLRAPPFFFAFRTLFFSCLQSLLLEKRRNQVFPQASSTSCPQHFLKVTNL